MSDAYSKESLVSGGDVQDQVMYLAETIERLDTTAAKLEQSLEMVLRQAEPESVRGVPEDVPATVPLAARLRVLNDRLNSIWIHLQYVQERVSI